MNKFDSWMKKHAYFALLGFVIVAVVILDVWQPEWPMRLTNLFAAGLAYTKMSLANLQVEAHGVSGLKRHKKLLGIPWPITLVYGFLLALIVSLGMTGTYSGFMPQTVLNFQLLSASALCGWFGGVAHWYYYAYHATYYIDEYAERVRMKAAGWTQEEVEASIENERREGLLGPQK